MKISILTLFPDMFQGPFDVSIIKRAKEKGLVEIELINIRDFGIGKHQMVDDTPYGGGVGMVMRVDVVYQAIEFAKKNYSSSETTKRSNVEKPNDLSSRPARTIHGPHHVILMSARGKTFNQQIARRYANMEQHLIIICAHYEGIDERIMQYVDEEISIGDFVLTGGELPAMLITDAVTRLIPSVITQGATDHESFSLPESTPDGEGRLLEYPQYTNPREYQGQSVPEVLLSGHHKNIEQWKKEQAREKTKRVRPDLLQNKD